MPTRAFMRRYSDEIGSFSGTVLRVRTDHPDDAVPVLAAARRIQAAGRRCVLLEASDRIGGRCLTDTASFGVPVDRGAHWIHMPDINPVTRLAGPAGFDVYPAPPGQRMRIGRRYAREGEMEDFLAAVVRANRAIGEAVRSGKADVSTILPYN